MFSTEAIKSALIGILLMASPLHAQGLKGVNTEVILRNNFNPFVAYGNTVKYYLSPNTRAVTFTVNGDQSYQIDIGAAAEEAMGEWERAMGIKFEQTLQQNEAQLRISILNGSMNNDHCGQSDTLAATFYPNGPKPSGSDPTVISYFKPIIQKMTSDGTHRTKLKNKSDEDFLDLLIKQISKHEIGHALGFMHPRTAMTQPIPTCGRLFQSANRYVNSSAAIMTPDFESYSNYLYTSLGRLITINDIGISPQEIAASGHLENDTCYPASGRTLSKLDSGVSAVRCQVIPQIYPVLLFGCEKKYKNFCDEHH